MLKAFQVFCCSCLESVYTQDCGVFDIFAMNLLFHLCSSKNCNPQSITIIKNVQVFCLKGDNNTMSWHIQFLWKTTHVSFANIWKFEGLFFMHVFSTKISTSFSPTILVLCHYLKSQRIVCFRISNISESGNQ